MARIQDDEVIQVLSSNRAKQSVDIWILPAALRRRQNLPHAQRRDSQTDVVAVNAVSISDEIPAWVSIGEGLYDLLRGLARQ
jgi:hypothetical protein